MLYRALQSSGANDFVEQLRTYVETTLHQPVQLNRWNGVAGLPTFLSQRYDFFTGSISRQPCLFAVDRDITSATPTEVAKHIAYIKRLFEGIVIYAAQRLSADRRARLIANGVPFIIPRNQLYIPQLALDLREYFRARPKRKPEQLSPAAQVLLFHLLLRRPQSTKALRDSYSAMSISRASRELAQLGLTKVMKHGRTNKVEFSAEPRRLVDMARPYLFNPARSRQYVVAYIVLPHIKQAGESALSMLTDLSPPPAPVYAVHYKKWSSLLETPGLTAVKYVEDATAVIELWRYDPEILAHADVVDRLSLYAQFWDNPDERVAKAAEDLLGQISW